MKRRSRRAAVCAAASVIILGGCGIRIPHSEVMKAAGTGPLQAGPVSGASGLAAGSGSGPGASPAGSGASGSPAGSEPGGSLAGAVTPNSALGSSPSGGSATGASSAGGTASGAGVAGKPAASAAGSAAGGSTAAAGSPIAVGNVGTYSGVVGSSLGAGQPMLQVWARWVNQHGGIDGHPIVLYTADDGGDPSKARSLAQQMVQQDHVVAFVGDMIPLTSASLADYSDSVKVPIVGGDVSDPDWNKYPMMFPQGTGALALYDKSVHLDADFIKQAGGNKLGILYCAEDSACTTSYQHAHAEAPNAGLNPVYSAEVSLSQPSFTAQCLQAQSAGVNILAVTLDANSVERVARDCSAQNFHPLYASGSVIVTSALAQDPQLEGMISIEPTFGWTYAGNAAAQQYQQAVATIDPGLAVSSATSAAWTSGVLLQTALAGASRTATVTSADVVAGLYRLHDNNLGGLAPPLTFVPGQNAPVASCYFGVQIQHGKWVSLNNGAAYC